MIVAADILIYSKCYRRRQPARRLGRKTITGFKKPIGVGSNNRHTTKRWASTRQAAQPEKEIAATKNCRTVGSSLLPSRKDR